MPFRQQNVHACGHVAAALLAATCLTPPALAQTSFIAPDGHNRYPGVTIFCPSGNGVAPCVFGGGGSGGGAGGAVTVNLGTGGAVSASNRFPVTDLALDGLISAGALSIAGTVGLAGGASVGLAAGTYTIGGVTQAGPWMVSLGSGASTIGTVGLASGASVALGAGSNMIGTVTVANPGGSGGAVSQSGSWTVGLTPGTSVGVASLPALPSGGNAIGTVGISNFPAVQSVAGSVSQAGGWTVGLSSGTSVGVSSLPALPAGTSAIGTVGISNFPSLQSVSGSISQAGSWTVGLGSGTSMIGTVTVANPGGGSGGAVSQSGSWTVGLNAGTTVSVASLPALPSGSNAIGTVGISNFPGVQSVSGSVSQAGSWTVGLSTGSAVGLAAGTTVGLASGSSVGVSALPTLPAGSNDIGFVDINSLPALPAGSNAIGSVSVSNFPSSQSVSGSVSQAGSWTVGLSPSASVALAAGSSAIGTVTVSNLPAGAATAANQAAPLAPIAPGAATATASVVMGCLANTTLPTFNAGQQGAVACDTAGHLYVVTVPSANNVPTYQQAVASGGASIYRAINAAASAMAANVKSSTGMVYGYEACNSGSAAAYLRLFALATAPTVGSSVPAISKLLPAGACQSTSSNVGLVFNTGIAVDVTSGSMADGDTSAVGTASQVTVEVYYK